MSIDDLLADIDLNDNYKPTPPNLLRDRSKKPSYVEEIKKSAFADPIDYDSLLGSNESPKIITRKPATLDDASKNQKMKELFNITYKQDSSMGRAQSVPFQPSYPPLPPNASVSNENENNFEVNSRRSGMKRVTQRNNALPKSDMNSSADQFQQHHHEGQASFQSAGDSFHKKESNFNSQQIQQLEDQVRALKQEQANLQEQLQKERQEKARLIEELEHERRDKQKLLLEAEEKLRQEKAALKEDFEKDKARLSESYRLEADILRQQISEHKHLESLANKIQDNAKDLEHLKNQLFLNHQQQVQEKLRSYEKVAMQLQERENELQKEKSFLESEKQRIAHTLQDFSRRETLFQSSIDGERQSVRQEKQLLQEIKDSLKQLELDTKRRLESEALLLQRQKDEFDHFKSEVSSQNLLRQRQLDNERSNFEQEKAQYREFTHKNNELIKSKFDDIERQQQKLANLEVQLLGKQRDLELKESQLQSMHSDFQHKIQLLDNERQQLLHKLKEVNDKEQLYNKEINSVQEFRQVYQSEKEAMQKKKLELAKMEAVHHQEKLQIEQEKQQLTVMHKTLSNLRTDIAQQNTMPQFSQTAQSLQPKASKQQKTEKPKISQPLVNNSSTTSNFDVKGYVNYLKNVDYLQK